MAPASEYPLARAFSARLLAAPAALDLPQIECSLSSMIVQARAAWPGVTMGGHAFAVYLGERLDVTPGELYEALGRVHHTDLFLACACAAGDAPALLHFERQHMAQVASFVARIDNSPVFADDVRQVLRDKLFVPSARSRAKILEYSGRGPLGGWLRVVAIRTARNLQRSVQPARAIDVGGGEGLQVRSLAPDPELRHFQRHYAREFRLACETTITAMPERRKNVLRLYYLDQLSSPAIARLYGVSGAAVRLWLKEARETMLAETRRLLGERLGLRGTELDSLIGMMQSQFDLSVSRLLRAGPTAGTGPSAAPKIDP